MSIQTHNSKLIVCNIIELYLFNNLFGCFSTRLVASSKLSGRNSHKKLGFEFGLF